MCGGQGTHARYGQCFVHIDGMHMKAYTLSYIAGFQADGVESMPSKTKRVTITIPKELFDEIRALSKSVSGFMAEAAADRLKRERYRQAVAESAGAWRSEDHPELEDVEDIIAYVDDLRAGWNREH